MPGSSSEGPVSGSPASGGPASILAFLRPGPDGRRSAAARIAAASAALLVVAAAAFSAGRSSDDPASPHVTLVGDDVLALSGRVSGLMGRYRGVLSGMEGSAGVQQPGRSAARLLLSYDVPRSSAADVLDGLVGLSPDGLEVAVDAELLLSPAAADERVALLRDAELEEAGRLAEAVRSQVPPSALSASAEALVAAASARSAAEQERASGRYSAPTVTLLVELRSAPAAAPASGGRFGLLLALLSGLLLAAGWYGVRAARRDEPDPVGIDDYLEDDAADGPSSGPSSARRPAGREV